MNAGCKRILTGEQSKAPTSENCLVLIWWSVSTNLSGLEFHLCEQKQYCNTLWLIASKWGNHNLYLRFLPVLWMLNFLHRPHFILFMRISPHLELLACLSQEDKYLKNFEDALCSGLPFLCIHKQCLHDDQEERWSKTSLQISNLGTFEQTEVPSCALSESRDTMKDQAWCVSS